MSLGVTPGGAHALEGDAHAPGLALHQRLRRQHVDHLGGADAEGDGAHAAVGAGVAVAAHQQRAGQGDALLGPDDVDDALAGLAEVEQPDAPAPGLVAHVVEASAAYGFSVSWVRPGSVEMMWSKVAKVRSGLRTAIGRASLIACRPRPPPSCMRCRLTCSSA